MIRTLSQANRLVQEHLQQLTLFQRAAAGCVVSPNSSIHSTDRTVRCVPVRSLHVSAPRPLNYDEPKNWLKYNEIVFPPTKEGEAERPAEVCHQRAHVKYQHDKMLYLCRMVRGMSVDEAKKQLLFKNRLGASILTELIEEAQDMAVEKHNVEYRSNMWIAEAFPTKAGFALGVRKHARMYRGTVHYRYIHIFIKLREGEPPEHYYSPKLTGHEHKLNYIADMRKRRILNAL